jgi:hypothetical protein
VTNVQGDQMSFWKKSPKLCVAQSSFVQINAYLCNFCRGKSSPKSAKVSNRPGGGNSPNLITLLVLSHILHAYLWDSFTLCLKTNCTLRNPSPKNFKTWPQNFRSLKMYRLLVLCLERRPHYRRQSRLFSLIPHHRPPSSPRPEARSHSPVLKKTLSPVIQLLKHFLHPAKTT